MGKNSVSHLFISFLVVSGRCCDGNIRRFLVLLSQRRNLLRNVLFFSFFALFFQRGAGVLQTNWFIASVLTELLLVFSIRSMMPAWKSGVPSGILTGLTLISMAAAIFLPYFPMTADFFGFQPPAFQDLLLIFLMTLLYGMSNEIVKKPLAKFLVKHQTLS